MLHNTRTRLRLQISRTMSKKPSMGYMYEAMHRSTFKKAMLFLGHCITAPIIMVFFTLKYMLLSIVLSLIFSGCKWLLSLFSICEPPTWRNVLGGALALWLMAYIYSLICSIILKYHYLKDPVFEDCNITAGISWTDYKRFKKERENKNESE